MVQDLCGIGALVTGASGGIGEGIARALAARGASVVCVARSRERLEGLAASICEAGGEAVALVGDVTNHEFLESTIAGMGQLGILVNNAGVNYPGPLLERSYDEIDNMVRVNLVAAIHGAILAARRMQEQGSGGVIVGVSSTLGHVGGTGRAVYSATKHALEGFTKSIAMELAPYGIRAVTVAPTFVETDMTRVQLSDPEFREKVESRIPMGELVSVSDVVEAVNFLVSKSSRMITGTSLLVDGGYTAG